MLNHNILMYAEKSFPFNINIGTHRKSYPLHSHDYCELTIIIGGSASHMVEDTVYPINKGEVYLIPPYYCHGITDVNELGQYNISFDIDKLMLVSPEIKKLSGFKMLFVSEPYYRYKHIFRGRLKLPDDGLDFVEKLCGYMLNEYTLRENGYRTILINYLTALISFLCRNLISEHDIMSDAFFTKIADTVVYIEEHYSSKCPVSVLADIACLSARQYDRIFKKVFDITPARYINRCRLSHARNRIIYEECSITQIAEECGFSDKSHFSKAFIKEYGIAPGKFRKTYN